MGGPDGNPGAVVLDAIRALLRSQDIAFRELHHAPTATSEESAEIRGEPLRIGGKALVIKIGEGFHLFVLSAALKLDSAAVKARFGVKKIRFASAEELKELTGLVPGSVPPFGRPILPLELYVDESILENERIAFNAGTLTDSIVMPVPAYVKVAGPQVFRFASE